MSTFLIVLIFSIGFMLLAFLGLALKTIFKKGGQLTTCGGGGCGCGATASCETVK